MQTDTYFCVFVRKEKQNVCAAPSLFNIITYTYTLFPPSLPRFPFLLLVFPSFLRRFEDESDTKIDRSAFTLADMAKWGLAHPAAATDTVLDLLQELRHVTEFPVLIAVDGINNLYGQSAYPYQGETLPSTRLSIPRALQCYDSQGFR